MPLWMLGYVPVLALVGGIFAANRNRGSNATTVAMLTLIGAVLLHSDGLIHFGLWVAVALCAGAGLALWAVQWPALLKKMWGESSTMSVFAFNIFLIATVLVFVSLTQGFLQLLRTLLNLSFYLGALSFLFLTHKTAIDERGLRMVNKSLLIAGALAVLFAVFRVGDAYYSLRKAQDSFLARDFSRAAHWNERLLAKNIRLKSSFLKNESLYLAAGIVHEKGDLQKATGLLLSIERIERNQAHILRLIEYLCEADRAAQALGKYKVYVERHEEPVKNFSERARRVLFCELVGGEDFLNARPLFLSLQDNFSSSKGREWYRFGLACLHWRLAEEASHAFSQAVRFQPDLADAYYQRGILLGGRGALEAARLEYEKALAISHAHLESLQALRRLLR